MPCQVLITEGTSLEEVEEDLAAAGVGFPLVVKSQFADGREGSHLLAVVHDRYAREKSHGWVNVLFYTLLVCSSVIYLYHLGVSLRISKCNLLMPIMVPWGIQNVESCSE